MMNEALIKTGSLDSYANNNNLAQSGRPCSYKLTKLQETQAVKVNKKVVINYIYFLQPIYKNVMAIKS